MLHKAQPDKQRKSGKVNYYLFRSVLESAKGIPVGISQEDQTLADNRFLSSATISKGHHVRSKMESFERHGLRRGQHGLIYIKQTRKQAIVKLI
jgi:hypothetical protein